MSAVGPPHLPAMDNTLGALLIGAFISCLILGITTVQLYFYVGRFPNDNIWTKLLVYSIWGIDTLQTVFQCHAVYFYLVSHYADPSVLSQGVWSLITMSLLEAFIGGAVEVFFAMRVWKLSAGNWFGKVITVLIAVLSVLHSCFGIAFTARTARHTDFAWWGAHMEWDTITGLSCAAAADIMIAGSMVYLLRSRRTAFAQSRTLVNKLILYSVETGLLTSIWALVIVITFATMPHNLIALGMLFILPKLYANSLMAMLNSRESLHSNGGFNSSDRMNLNGSSHPLRAEPIQLRSHGASSHQWDSLRSQTDSFGKGDMYPLEYTLDKKSRMPMIETEVHIV